MGCRVKTEVITEKSSSTVTVNLLPLIKKVKKLITGDSEEEKLEKERIMRAKERGGEDVI
jgi:hypothetical protein